MSLLAGMGVDSSTRTKAGSPGLNPMNPLPPPPLASINKAMTVEELERSFEFKKLEMDSRAVAPPPGFNSGPSPVMGSRPIGPSPIGHHRTQQQQQEQHQAAMLNLLQQHVNPLSQLGLAINNPQQQPLHRMISSSPQPGNMLSNHPNPSMCGPQGPHNAFGPFDPREMGGMRQSPFGGPPMVTSPAAFNPFNSFGPIMPGQHSSLMMQSLSSSSEPKRLSPPVPDSSNVQMNQISSLNSAFGVSKTSIISNLCQFYKR